MSVLFAIKFSLLSLYLSIWFFSSCIFKFFPSHEKKRPPISSRKRRANSFYDGPRAFPRRRVYIANADWFRAFPCPDLDPTVNAYPVHLIRLCLACVLPRYHVWNWLVQSNYRLDGVTTDLARPDFIQLLYVTRHRRRRRRAESFYSRAGFNRLTEKDCRRNNRRDMFVDRCKLRTVNTQVLYFLSRMYNRVHAIVRVAQFSEQINSHVWELISYTELFHL